MQHPVHVCTCAHPLMRMARAWHVQAPFYAELLEEAHYANAAFYTSNYGQFPTNGKYEWLWLVGCDQQARGWLEAARHPKTAELRTAKLARIAKLVEELHNVGKLPMGTELHEVRLPSYHPLVSPFLSSLAGARDARRGARGRPRRPAEGL